METNIESFFASVYVSMKQMDWNGTYNTTLTISASLLFFYNYIKYINLRWDRYPRQLEVPKQLYPLNPIPE